MNRVNLVTMFIKNADNILFGTQTNRATRMVKDGSVFMIFSFHSFFFQDKQRG